MSGIRPVSMITYDPASVIYDSKMTASQTSEITKNQDDANTIIKAEEDKKLKENIISKESDEEDSSEIARDKRDELLEQLAEASQKRIEMLKESITDSSDKVVADNSDQKQNLNGLSQGQLETLYRQKKISYQEYITEIEKRESLPDAISKEQDFELWAEGFNNAIKNDNFDIMNSIIK